MLVFNAIDQHTSLQNILRKTNVTFHCISWRWVLLENQNMLCILTGY